MTTISPAGNGQAPALHNIAPPRGDTVKTRHETRHAASTFAAQHPGISNAIDSAADKHPKAAKLAAGFVVNHPNTARTIGQAAQTVTAAFTSHTA
jgi:hypothetical protein